MSLEELASICPNAKELEEGGFRYVYLPSLQLGEKCTPSTLDCLLCLDTKDGYPTRFYFAQQVTCSGKSFNWNGTVHILGRNWSAFSWKDVASSTSVVQVLLGHLDALR